MQTLKPRIKAIGSRLTVTINPSSWRNNSMGGTARGYGYRWQLRRSAQLGAHPLCAYCQADGRITAATIADHIEPHRGDRRLFDGPLQSLCAACHSSRKQKEEAR